MQVIFKRIGGAGSFSHHSLIICRLVTLNLTVKCARRKWHQVLFFGEFEILPMSTTFRFARYGIVVGLKDLVDELQRLGPRLPFSTRASKLRQQADKATPKPQLCVSIPPTPATFGSRWDG